MENYLPLFAIALVAWLVPTMLSWAKVSKVPSVILEIVIGILIGPFVFNLVSGTEIAVNFMAEMGFLFLIFLSGLALDTEKIVSSFPKGGLKLSDFTTNTFFLASGIYAGSVLLAALLVAFIPIFPGIDKTFLVILLPSVALSIIVPVIKGDGEIERKFGQIILIEGALATIFTILMIAVYSGIHQNGFRFELLLFLVIFIVFIVAYRIGHALVRVKAFNKLQYELAHAASQIRVRGSIAVLLFFIVVAVAINTEPVLGAFFAGALISIFITKDRSALLFKLDGMSYGFFIPIFFIMVGVKLDLSAFNDLSAGLSFILFLLGSFYVIQIVPAFIQVWLFGWKRSLSSGILLTSRLGLSIATAHIGLELGLINSTTNAGIVIASIMSCVLSPMLYKFLNSTKREAEKRIYIAGGGAIGQSLADRLRMHGIPYLVIEPSIERWQNLHEMGIDCKNANDLDIETYRSLGIRDTETIVVSSDSDERNIAVTKVIRLEFGHKNLVAITKNPDHYRDDMDLTDVPIVDVHRAIADTVENRLLRPNMMEALTGSFATFGVIEVLVGADTRSIKDIPFPQSGAVLTVKREDKVFVPKGKTKLRAGDVATVFGDHAALEEFRKLLE